jgi:hypothetical protein
MCSKGTFCIEIFSNGIEISESTDDISYRILPSGPEEMPEGQMTLVMR